MSEEKSKKTKAILERIEKERGFVRLWPKLLAERDPDFMECLHNVTTHALHKRDHLPRKMKEIIIICLNAFDYYEYGFRIHVRSALKAGVTEDELLDALEVVGVLKYIASPRCCRCWSKRWRNTSRKLAPRQPHSARALPV